MLLDVAKLVTAYYAGIPDPSVPAQRVAFGTSGHRGSAFATTFNEWHVLAISEAICRYRRQQRIDGPLFLGIDTHALSVPACTTAVEVLAANGVEIMLAEDDAYTPTPAVSHAILCYNRGRSTGGGGGGAGRWHCRYAVAQSAGRRRLQVQPPDRGTGRYRRDQMDRGPGE